MLASTSRARVAFCQASIRARIPLSAAFRSVAAFMVALLVIGGDGPRPYQPGQLHLALGVPSWFETAAEPVLGPREARTRGRPPHHEGSQGAPHAEERAH